MLVLIEAGQMAYPDVENVAKYFKALTADIVVVGKKENRYDIAVMVTLMGLDGFKCYEESGLLDDRIKLYESLIEKHNTTPDGTILISNSGLDLTAAILMNMDFVWGFDVS